MTYRVRIGCFVMPGKLRCRITGIKLNSNSVKLTLRILMLACALLVTTCGDVERNPGPGSERTTRQQKLSFSQAAKSPPILQDFGARAKTQRQVPRNDNASNADLLDYLKDFKMEIRNDFSSLNTKIDEINSTVADLKIENEQLKSENVSLWKEIDNLKYKTDNCEAQMKRNNLKFNGIQGKINEPWNVTESKVRSFIKNDLNLPNLENVDIERAHRMKSNASTEKCMIIVKFTKYKDRDEILNRAKRCLYNTSYSVNEDFTERIRAIRRELGKRLVTERDQGKYASMNYDKLIVEDTIYGYNDREQSIYEIGPARGKPGTKWRQRRARVPMERDENLRTQDDGTPLDDGVTPTEAEDSSGID